MKVRECFEDEEQQFWESLTTHERMLAFCQVMRILHDAEFKDRGTYRYTLYEKFGFGKDAYMRAQLAGFLDIHNALYNEATRDALEEEIFRAKLEEIGKESPYAI